MVDWYSRINKVW